MTEMLKVNRGAALKELELTPIWTLKKALRPAEGLVESAIVKPVEQAIKIEQAVQANVPIFAWQSEDGNWLMLTENLNEQEKNLLKNISLALGITLKAPQNHHSFLAESAQMLILFGHHLAQHLNGLPATITHRLAHLLAHGADKAQTWQDLCAARVRLQGLNSAQ